MFFDDWNTNNQYKNSHINPTLLWEYDVKNLNWDAMRRQVVERVVKLGDTEDFYAAIRLYGGLENFRKIIRDELVGLTKRDISFVCSIFDLKEKELNSVKRKAIREQALGFPGKEWFW